MIGKMRISRMSFRPLISRGLVGFLLGNCLAITHYVRAAEAPTPSTSPTVAVTSTTTEASGPTSPALASDPAAVKWLRAMEERHRDHRRASGEFTQVRKDPVFLEDIHATGKFYYERPNRFRCDYNQDKPEQASTTLVDGNLVAEYFPALKQLVRCRLNPKTGGIGDVNQMLLAFGIETNKVLKHFTVTSDPETSANLVRLTFASRAPRQERPFEQFILEMSKPDLTPKRFEIVGQEGDRTLVSVTIITWNPSLAADVFRLNVPKDVEIIEEE